MEEQWAVWSSGQLSLCRRAAGEEKGMLENGQVIRLGCHSLLSLPNPFLLDSKENVPEPPQLFPDLCAADPGSDNQMV